MTTGADQFQEDADRGDTHCDHQAGAEGMMSFVENLAERIFERIVSAVDIFYDDGDRINSEGVENIAVKALEVAESFWLTANERREGLVHRCLESISAIEDKGPAQ